VGLDGKSDRIRQFEKLVLVHLNDLYRAALRLTAQATDAEDLVQETCLRAFKLLDQLKHPSAAKVWVFSILRSVFLRQAERMPSRGALISLEDIEASLVTASDALHDAYEGFLPMRETLLQEVREGILRLPLPYREAVILAHIGGFSYREIAHILAVPTGTVMSRLYRGRRMLRAYLGERPSRLESSP
jgi:RNA polymerase sigma-70 factor, ECF subfamily